MSSSLYAACFIQIVFRVTGAAACDGVALAPPVDGAVLPPPELGAGVAEPEQAPSTIAAPARSAANLRAPTCLRGMLLIDVLLLD